MQDITTTEFDAHIIPTPPKGESLDEYIARRVGEEIERQVRERLTVHLTVTPAVDLDPHRIGEIAAAHLPFHRS